MPCRVKAATAEGPRYDTVLPGSHTLVAEGLGSRNKSQMLSPLCPCLNLVFNILGQNLPFAARRERGGRRPGCRRRICRCQQARRYGNRLGSVAESPSCERQAPLLSSAWQSKPPLLHASDGHWGGRFWPLDARVLLGSPCMVPDLHTTVACRSSLARMAALSSERSMFVGRAWH